MIETGNGMTLVTGYDKLAINPVMAGLVPAIHVLSFKRERDVDARDEPTPVRLKLIPSLARSVVSRVGASVVIA
jgi:hypothetical protein